MSAVAKSARGTVPPALHREMGLSKDWRFRFASTDTGLTCMCGARAEFVVMDADHRMGMCRRHATRGF